METEHTDAQTNKNTVEQCLRQIISYIGDDPNREGLLETPKRVINSWDELYSGYKNTEEFDVAFAECGGYDQIVVLKDIDFCSMCEHHMLPFWGKVHIGYLPKEKVIGISKLARIVEKHCRKLQIQERLTTDIAMEIVRAIQPEGVGVVINGKHFCMTSRGVKRENSQMVTSSVLGKFMDQHETRREFFNLIEK